MHSDARDLHFRRTTPAPMLDLSLRGRLRLLGELRLLGILCLLGLLACATSTPSPHVVVLGFSGIDAQTVEAKIAEGTLPHFAALRRQGAYGVLGDQATQSSPTAWTTLASGRKPATHGVKSVIAAGTIDDILPTTSHGRRVNALWNIASAAHMKVLSVAWPATWPVEDIFGQMVAEHSLFVSDTESLTTPTERAHSVYPASLQGLINQRSGQSSLTNTYRDLALDLWRQEQPDLTLAYFEGIAGRAHVDADRLLGAILKAADETTTVVVLSLPNSPGHGTVHLHGPEIRAQGQLQTSELLDIAPTVLALLGLPVAEDLPGRVLNEGFRQPLTTSEIASYEVNPDARSATAAVSPFNSLGYLKTSSTTESSATPPNSSSQRHLASLYVERGYFVEAADIYRALIRDQDDDAFLRSQLAATYGALGLYDQALEQIEYALSLDPLVIEAYHQRAVIWERQGDEQQAVADYSTALRYQRDYEPSRRALQRLVGTAETRTPKNSQEEEAARLIERAVESARQGNYDHSLLLLDAAEDAAPPYVVTYQYRAYLYYLKGEIKEAIKAIELGLMVEPKNALFLQNLKRLKAEPPRKPPAGSS